MSCTKCNKSHSTVQAFLLTCNDCKRKWHHRCHLPPVPDQELVARIKAHNAGDKANGLQAWKCKYCTEGGIVRKSDTRESTPTLSAKPSPNVQPQSISQLPLLRDPSVLNRQLSIPPLQSGTARTSSKPAPRSSKPSRVRDDEEVLIIHDSDSDTPPSKPSKPAKASTSGPRPAAASSGPLSTIEKADKSISRPSKALHPLAQEEEESSDSTRNLPLSQQRYSESTLDQLSSSNQPIRSTADHASKTIAVTTLRPRKKRASENAIGSSQRETIPLSQEEKERKRETYKRQAAENEKRRRFEHKQRQQELMRAKSEEKEPQLERVTTYVVDLTLDTPKKPTQAHIQNTAFLSLESPKATTPEADTPASPIIISVTRVVANKDPQKEPELDLLPQWIHARKPDRDVWDRCVQKKACAAPPSQSRRKFRAQQLGDVQPHIYHFDSFHWVDRMKKGPR